MSTSLPKFLQIEPVGQCNLRCRMCPILFRKDGPPYGPPAFMELDAFRSLVDQFEGLEELHLQGLGEPMMHPGFFEMVRYAAGKGIRVTTNTNLTLLNDRRAGECVSSGLFRIHVSIDGATAETYERIRVRSSFDKILRNMKLLIRKKEEAGSRLPEIHVVMVLMRQNLAELPDMVRLAANYGAGELFVQHLCNDYTESGLPEQYLPMRDFVEQQTLVGADEQDISTIFETSRALAQELRLQLRLPRLSLKVFPPGTPGSKRCDWPWRGAYVSYQGLAMPCCMVSTPDRINLGNMKADGVQKVWDGGKYREFREQLDSEDDPPEVCKSCSLYKGVF